MLKSLVSLHAPVALLIKVDDLLVIVTYHILTVVEFRSYWSRTNRAVSERITGSKRSRGSSAIPSWHRNTVVLNVKISLFHQTGYHIDIDPLSAFCR